MAKGRRISQNRLLTPEEAQRNREIEQTTKSEVAEMFARRKAEREGAIERPDEAPGPATVYDMLELNSFITSLREAREAMGLSLTDLSRLTGINRTSLNALELFKNQNPTWGTLARYARAVRRPITLKLGDSTDDEPAETVAAKSEQ